MDDDLALILQQCLEGGTNAQWESFVRLAQPPVAAAVLRSLSRSSSHREVADDLIQETFLKIFADNFRVLRNFRGRGHAELRAYLKIIASSIVMDYFRSGKARALLNIEEIKGNIPSTEPPHGDIVRKQLLDHVEKCLTRTDSRSRRLFWLYHRDGLLPREIAALPGMELGLSGIETAIYRLTTQVRDCLRRAGAIEVHALRERDLA
jgi:RNA polymerase sigma factor (sigma-70 family)